MADTERTPQSAQGWKAFTRALAYKLPGRLGQVRRSGKRIVAAAAPAPRGKG